MTSTSPLDSRRHWAVAAVLMTVGLWVTPALADDQAEGSDRGAAPRGASGAILVPPPKPDVPPPEVSFPVLKRHVDPAYPPEAVQAGIQGEVILKITVERDGTVSKAQAVQGPGHGLDQAAETAALQLLFEPARRQPDGKAIKATILFKYSFTLQWAPVDPASHRPLPAKLLGTVVTGPNKTPFAGATVTVTFADGTTRELTTDENGRFDLPELTAGTVAIDIAATGYETVRLEEELKAGESLEVRYRLLPMDEAYGGGVGVIDVTVKGDRPNREVLRRTVEEREINRIPGTKGDALRSLENLPGVARPPPFTGMLIVRGSAPEDSIAFIDGTAVPLAYHFGGLASVVPTELIEQIDFYPGNFSSKYGRAMGGIVEVGLRSPRTDGYHGLAQVDFIDGRLQLEGPIPFLDDWAFLAAGRRSWLDALLTPVLDGVDGIDVVQSPAYYDYQFMIENKPDPDSRFRVSFYGSDDGFEIVGEDLEEETTGGFDLHMAFMRGQASYQSKLSGGHQVDAMFSLNRDVIDFSIFDSNIGRFFVDIEVRSMSNRLGYSHRITDWLALNTGLDIVGGEATVTTRLPVKFEDGEDDDGAPSDAAYVPPDVEEEAYSRTFFRPAGFVEAVVTPARHLRIVPGVRLDYSLRTDSVDVSPRLNASYGLFPGFPQTTIKAAVGLYPQPPDFLKIIGEGEIDHLESNRAVHYGLGLEQDITRQLEVSFEGFVKQLSNLVVTIDGEGDADPRDDNDGKGYAVGGELMVKYKPDAHFFGWLAYTLSRSARRDQPNEDEVLVTYDQTHILTVLGSYRLGAGWEVGARFRLVSGNLITPLICNPEDEGCEPTIGSIYHAPSGSYIRLPGSEPNSERLPLFHQLDLRVDKTWSFESWKFGMYLDVMNVYNHMADEGVRYSYDFANREYVGGLPIIPSLGMRGQF